MTLRRKIIIYELVRTKMYSELPRGVSRFRKIMALPYAALAKTNYILSTVGEKLSMEEIADYYYEKPIGGI